MGRTRSALLQATAECVARYGIRKTTMVDVASKSGVAKATLYNHFRTKGDVLAAVAEQQVGALVGACVTLASSQGLPAALAHAAATLGANPALRKAAEDEPALLAPLMTPADGRGWQLARDGVAAVLTAGGAPSGPAEVELVLRWCASQILWPLGSDSAAAGAGVVVRGLAGPLAAPTTDGRPSAGVASRADVPEQPSGAGAGLGWPG
jgi:AcrR family transcriptional regulator